MSSAPKKKSEKQDPLDGLSDGARPFLASFHDWDWMAMVGIVACLAYSISTVAVGWDHTINDRHSFRQSQTATTALYLVNQSFRWAYETPILGKPWSIPMEVPVYQWLVARFSGLTHYPLDQAGRLISLVFFILTTVPLYALFRLAGVQARLASIPVMLFMISPFYLFWSRTFMIESTVLFFAVAWLATAVFALKRKSLGWHCTAILLGCLAALTKVTTFIGFLPVVGLLMFLWAWPDWFSHWDLDALKRHLIRIGLICLLPLAAALLWVAFSDTIKSENPLAAAYLTSGCPHNSAWSYGTLEQKLSGFVWGIILGRFPELIGSPPLAWLLLGAVITVSLIHCRRWRETVFCLGAYLLAPTIFTNLHFVHDYYANANGVFLLAALAFALVGLLEDPRTRMVGMGFFLLAIVAAVGGHREFYLPRPLKDNREIIEAAEQIRSVAPEDSVIICLGNDWSPLVSYYARRRALNLPMDNEGKTPPNLIAQAFKKLSGEKIGAVVLVEPVTYPKDLAMEQLRAAGITAPILHLQNLPRY